VLVATLLGLLFSLAYAGGAQAHPTLPASQAHPVPSAAQTVPCANKCGPSGDPYWGADYNTMVTATNDWPQANGNWCGVADVDAIDRYDWLKTNGTDPHPGQQGIANLMNNSSSPWGTAYSWFNPPAFSADIAADSGADPRAQAWAAYQVTPNNFYFHNYIYSPYQGSTNNSATYQVALDYGPSNGVNNPVIVIIWGGRHSLVEDGVIASSDPSAGGETIDAIDLWDSAYQGRNPDGTYSTGYLFGYRNNIISLYDWENSTYGHSGYYFWTYPYDAGTWGDVGHSVGIPIDPNAMNSSTRNTGDPDPHTQSGSYYTVNYFDGTKNLYVHWENSFVTIEQDYVTILCGGSPNYALDRYGNLAWYNGSNACG
jgi:hypothetical protein